MRLDREQAASGPRLTGFSADGGFKVDGQVRPGGVLLTGALAQDWAPPPLDALTQDALAPVLDPLPEFLLLGTGPVQGQPSASLRRAMDALGIGIEAMDSRAAARLWGVLRAEGREIAAALYPLR